MIGLVRVGREIEVADQHAEEQVRAELGVDQAGVLADPAEARVRGEHAFEHGARVDVGAPATARPRERLERVADGAQAIEHHVVVVVAAGVAGDRGRAGIAALIPFRSRRRARRRVRSWHRQRDCGGRRAFRRCGRAKPSRRGGRARSSRGRTRIRASFPIARCRLDRSQVRAPPPSHARRVHALSLDSIALVCPPMSGEPLLHPVLQEEP